MKLFQKLLQKNNGGIKMQSIADIIILIPIILSTYMAYKKGFFRTLLALMSNIISIGLSFLLQPIIYSTIKDTPITDRVKNAVANTIPEIESSLKPAEFINNLEFPDFIKEMLINSLNDNLLNNVNAKTFIAEYVSDFFIHIFSFVLTFFVISFIFVFIRKIICTIRTLPILKQFDSLAGAFLGLIRGVLLSFIIVIIAILMQTYDTSGFIKTSIDNSVIIHKVTESDIFKQITENVEKPVNSASKKNY